MNSDNKKLRLEKVNIDNFYPIGKLKVRRDIERFSPGARCFVVYYSCAMGYNKFAIVQCDSIFI